MITRERAELLIDRFKDRKIAVIGDVILDKYLWGDVERISPEAPVPVVDVKRETYNLGGASNVAWNLSALGVKTVILGVVGKDENGKLIERMLLDKKITPNLIVDDSRPTIEKTRIIAVSQQLLRIDRESREDLSVPVKKDILKNLEVISSDVEGFIISDYGKGVIFEEIVKFCVSTGKPVFVDPKPKNFNLYRNITIMTPNKKEAYECVKASGSVPLEEVGYRIIQQLSMDTLLITLGSEGMALFEGKSVKRIPARAKKVFDVTGAGDTVISILAASKLSGGSWEESATLANYGAGYVVGEIGTAVVTPDMLLDTVLSY
ncbi:MAG: D-glycero-beta-D-manno-heptose-7-phosphate kinase [Hydrogenothermaceae bacterium]